MKNRLTIFTTFLSVVACFGLLPLAQAQSGEGDIGGGNTVEGFDALSSVTSGGFNTALGWGSQAFLTDAFFNTGVGAGTLVFNDGTNNTAVGTAALILNTSDDNTAVGAGALENNTSGNRNCAFGSFALFSNQVSGNASNAFGFQALFNNDSDAAGLGLFNNAFGWEALFSNVDGDSNTAMGDFAGGGITGSRNVAIGRNTMTGAASSNDNTVVGVGAGGNIATLGGNIYLGVGVTGPADEINFIRIGTENFGGIPYDTFIAGIFNRDVALATAVPVFVDDTGKLGTNLVDAAGNKVATPQAMLNESRNQQKRIAELEDTVARLAATVKEQATQIQKVSAQLEMSKPAPQVVVNKP